MGLRYVLQVICVVENYSCANNSTITKARVKINTYLKSVEFRISLIYVSLNLKTIKFYLIKLATDFY